ncbi:hypothetical protein AB0O86_36800 [Streptomyces hirsutus]|uniref:hypothetical protein n=1 Tax=Streptomyces hirsutus TaxID=35620 RepID=UPI00342680AE
MTRRSIRYRSAQPDGLPHHTVGVVDLPVRFPQYPDRLLGQTERLHRLTVGGQGAQRGRRLCHLLRIPGGIGVLDVLVPCERPRINQRQDPVPGRTDVGASGGGPQLQALAQSAVLGDPLLHQRQEFVPGQRREPCF